MADEKTRPRRAQAATAARPSGETDGASPAKKTLYMIERRVTLEDLGVQEGQANGADTSGVIRNKFAELGGVWVYVGEAEATRGQQALEAVLGVDIEKVKAGDYRYSSRRYVSDAINVAPKVQTTLIFGK